MSINAQSASYVAEETRYLISTSATTFPPALAGCEVLGSFPFRLYRTMSFEKLHVFDLYVPRVITDNAQKYYLRSPTCAIWASAATKIAHQRMSDLPRSSKLWKMKLFRSVLDERMSGVTGQIRRDSCPFLWVCTMGIEEVQPDEDGMVQSCLLINEINIRFWVINHRSGNTQLNEELIDQLQELCTNLGQALI